MREYYYIATFQWKMPLGHTIGCRDGTVVASATDTRQSLVSRTVEWVKANQGVPDDAIILFLSIEPNELAA